MKKKIFLLCLMILLFTGCTNNKKEEIISDEKDTNKLNSKIVAKLNCNLIQDDIVAISSYICNDVVDDASCEGIIVTKNHLYHYAPFGEYSSNKQQCKEINLTLESDEELVKMYTSSEIISNKYIYRIGHNPEIYERCTDEWCIEDQRKYISNMNEKMALIQKLLSENEAIEKIQDDIIKTNKAVYILKQRIANKDECEKYTDIECQYEYYLEKKEIFDSIINDIIGIGEFIVDKDFNIYKY